VAIAPPRRLAFATVVAIAFSPAIVRGAEPDPRAYEGPAAAPTETVAGPTLGSREPTEPTPPTEPMPSPAPAADPVIPESPEEATAPPRVRPLPEPRSDVRVRLGLDLALTIGLAAPTAAMGLWVEPSLPDRLPEPGDESEIGKFDRLALNRFDNSSKIASDILLPVAIAAPLVYHAIEAGVQRRGYSRVRGRGFLARYGTDLIIIAQAISINALVTQILKTAVRRPRPYTFTDPTEVPASERQALIDAQSGTQADWSFPSGHTSTAFVATTAGATLLTLELLGRSKWAIATAWIGGLGVASTVGILRVTAGRHFPSDVVTSALLGIGIGVAVPLAHWKPTTPGDRVRLDKFRNVALSPFASKHSVGLRIGGAFK
jgi:membrane-associated phospholipid phosphatase